MSGSVGAVRFCYPARLRTRDTSVDYSKKLGDRMHVTKEDIKEGLRRLGLGKNDIVMVHSSLSSLGYVEGGADTVIDALLEARPMVSLTEEAVKKDPERFCPRTY